MGTGGGEAAGGHLGRPGRPGPAAGVDAPRDERRRHRREAQHVAARHPTRRGATGLEAVQDGGTPGRVRAGVQGAPPAGRVPAPGEGAPQGTARRGEHHEVPGERAEPDESVAAVRAARAGGEGQQRGRAHPGVRHLDRDVHEEETERADSGRAVHALGEQPVARGQQQPVGGEEPPGDGRGERDQGEDAARVVEEAVQVHAPAR
ncbi:hypothetical protein ACR820_12570 [Streptomyces netropsis]